MAGEKGQRPKKQSGGGLAAAMARAAAAPVAGPDSAAGDLGVPADLPAPHKAKVGKAGKAAPAPAPGRQGTKQIAGHFAPELSIQLRLIAVEESRTVQDLLEEAITDLLVKKGKRVRRR
ncbi:hypothetical protein EOE18_13940 [Novosphingobium umbonatum]|uniref:Antitoxin-like ribbon-helix-helix domain-containing protein n=1 Tax=Novosphingobium umbonatum TaxID=1908524 RepID=A0A437N208_9SPHN|nr:ribbon-helix-helix domain-containing protein [Novosphingobium umbonatum]RVU03950.1 hypothetical protein EOE18_13940 [Novosphingobium umbonatum]